MVHTRSYSRQVVFATSVLSALALAACRDGAVDPQAESEKIPESIVAQLHLMTQDLETRLAPSLAASAELEIISRQVEAADEAVSNGATSDAIQAYEAAMESLRQAAAEPENQADLAALELNIDHALSLLNTIE